MSTTDRIKVAFVINDFTVGGAQRLLADILLRIDRSRFDPVLITLMRFPEKPHMDELIPDATPHYALDLRKFADLRGWLSFIRLTRTLRPDVVISNLFLSNTITRIIAPFVGYKTIAVEHNTYTGKRRWEKYLDWFLAKTSFAIVAVSKQVRDFTLRQENIPIQKLCTIRNGIDVETVAKTARSVDKNDIRRKLGVSSNRRIIISIARLTPQKDPLLLLRGFELFAETNPLYDLVLVGAGSLYDVIVLHAAQSPVASRIHVLGNRSDAISFLAVSEFFVSTSKIEGLSIAHLEALACGVPVLATRTAGSEEVLLNEKNGIFIENITPDGVVRGMERMRDISPSLRENAYQSACHYDIQRAVAAYEKLIAQAFQNLKDSSLQIDN